MKRSEIKRIAKDVIQSALSTAYYDIADGTSRVKGASDLTEDEQNEVIEEIDRICKQLCKRMGREHYSV